MWFLLKSVVGVVVLALAGYTLFAVDFGGKPLARHLHEVWQSDAVQQKVELVRAGVKSELEERLAAAAEQSARDRVRQKLGGGDEFNDEDKRALEAMLREP